MKDSELRTRAKALALHIISVCDEVDKRKGSRRRKRSLHGRLGIHGRACRGMGRANRRAFSLSGKYRPYGSGT